MRLTKLLLDHSLSRLLFQAVENLNWRHAASFVVTSTLVGQVLNLWWPLTYFHLYQLLFIPAVVMAIYEIKRFLRSASEYCLITAAHPNRHAGDYLQRLLDSYWVFPGLLIVGGMFLYSIIELNYIQINPTGIYAIVIVFLIMVSSILGQTCFVYYLLLLRRINDSREFRYNFYLPARTDWVRLLANAGTRLTNAFFILGFIYTLVYYLNVPAGYVKLTLTPSRLELATPNDVVFLVNWTAIILLIILAFPLYSSIRLRYIRSLVRKLKDISIDELQFLLAEASSRSRRDVDAEVKCYHLMANIDSSAATPLDSPNLIPITATLCTIAVHLIRIAESF